MYGQYIPHKSPISAELEDFKKHFDSCLSSSNLLLNSVIAHIRQKNGKMMRPILVLLAAKLYNEILSGNAPCRGCLGTPAYGKSGA